MRARGNRRARALVQEVWNSMRLAQDQYMLTHCPCFTSHHSNRKA